jgi:hypothetical protein
MAAPSAPFFDRERFDSLMKLADFRIVRIADRRRHEWTVTVGLWAVLAAGILKPVFGPSMELCVLLGFIVAAHATLWVRPHWVRSKQDADFAFAYQDQARQLLDPEAPPPRAFPAIEDQRGRRDFDFLDQAMCQAQIVATATLAAAVWVINASTLG